jgi:hypothetical protein
MTTDPSKRSTSIWLCLRSRAGGALSSLLKKRSDSVSRSRTALGATAKYLPLRELCNSDALTRKTLSLVTVKDTRIRQ